MCSFLVARHEIGLLDYCSKGHDMCQCGASLILFIFNKIGGVGIKIKI